MEAEIQNALKALQHASSDTVDAVTGFFFFLFIYLFFQNKNSCLALFRETSSLRSLGKPLAKPLPKTLAKHHLYCHARSHSYM
jgi:hypothetical protein